MDKNRRPTAVRRWSRNTPPKQNGEDTNTKGICPAALGTKDQQPAAYSPKTGLFYVPTNHVCMDYEPYKVELHRRPALCGRDAVDVSAPGRDPHGQLHRLGRQDRQDRLVEARSSSRSGRGALATAGGVVFYGTLEGYLKAVDAKTGKELYKFKTPSGIIGNVNTYEHGGKQYVAVSRGVGGWAGIGLAAGLTGDQEGLGAVGGYRRSQQLHRPGRHHDRVCTP